MSGSAEDGVLARAARTVRDGAELRLVAFGSSTTEGYGAGGPERSYPAVLRELLSPSVPGGIALFNHGISGESSLEMDGRVAAVLDARPDLVIWQTGSNDAARPVPLDTFAALTRSGIGRIRGTGADLVLMDQQFCDALEVLPALPAYLDALHRIAAEEGVALFRRHALMRDWCASGRWTRTALSPDGTHMRDDGYAALARAVADWLAPRLQLAAAGRRGGG